MKKFMIAATFATVTAGIAGVAAAESTVVQQQQRLDRVIEQQRAQIADQQVSLNGRSSFLDRTFGRITFGATDPSAAQRGARFDPNRFGSGNRGR
ncbi:MAG: hypothetical protein AAF415_08740 [Pseudomonadota bacterium]